MQRQPEIRYISTNDDPNIVIPIFQRDPEAATLALMAMEGWDPDRAGPIWVNLRPNGKLAIIDGRTRREGARQLNVPTIRAEIHQIPVDREEEMFIRLNDHKYRRPLRKRELWKARSSNIYDEQANTINGILLDAGFHIVTTKNRSDNAGGGIAAVGTIEKIFGKSPEVLSQTLVLIRECWGVNTSLAKSGHIIEGIGEFLLRYAVHPNFSAKKAKMVLSKQAISDLQKAGRSYSAERKIRLAAGICHAIYIAYNKATSRRISSPE